MSDKEPELDNYLFVLFSMFFLYIGMMGFINANSDIAHMSPGFYEAGYFKLIVSLLEIICGFISYIIFKMR